MDSEDELGSIFALRDSRSLFEDLVRMVNEEYGANGKIGKLQLIRSDVPGEEILHVEIVYSRIADIGQVESFKREVVRRLQENEASLSVVPMEILVHGGTLEGDE